MSLFDSAPATPRKTWSTLDSLTHFKGIRTSNHPGYVDIDEDDDRYKMQIHFLNVQPGRRVWSECFYLTVACAGTHKLQGHVYGANLPEAEPLALTIQADVEHTSLTVDQLVGLADAHA